MVCIYCGSKTHIINSRPQKRLNQTWRRHQCIACHAIFTTEESVEYAGSIVVRRPKTPQTPFSRDKLFVSILKALGHRQTALEDAGSLCDTIIAQLLLSAHNAALEPATIVAITYETLQRFDTVAAMQYQAYHKP